MDFREGLIARGREMRWHPPHMFHRFENWVSGLTGDWSVSRQRFFGVPFRSGTRCGQTAAWTTAAPIVPPEARLPVDPSTDVPEGYEAAQRDRPGGFTADPT